MAKKRPKARSGKTSKGGASRKMRTPRSARSEPRSSAIGRKVKVFRDAVHDLISLGPEDSFILELIDTKEFQRLRGIRQLGLANLVYPCAEHSRFVHSLGVFNFARRMIAQLLTRHGEENQIKTALERHTNTIKAAALLHDLGHGSFSHVLERVFEDANPVKHEEWTCRIIRDENTEIHERLKGAGVNISDVCALVWDQAPEKYPDVNQVVEPFIMDIVSSQLDADRMDYLLRDSLLTGARYGQYDCEWIMNALAIGEEPWGERKLKLCLDASKGTGAINEFLIARLLMTQHVYGHKTTRAYESELLCTLRLAAHLADDLPDSTPQAVRDFLAKRGKVPVNTYLRLDDGVAWWALRRWATWMPKVLDGHKNQQAAALQRHALRLVRRHRPWAMHPLDEDRLVHVSAIIRRLREREDPLLYECSADDGKILPYKDLALSLREISDPEEAYYREIFLLEKDGSTCRLSLRKDEPLLGALRRPATQCRFFYDREFREDFARLLSERGVSLE